MALRPRWTCVKLQLNTSKGAFSHCKMLATLKDFHKCQKGISSRQVNSKECADRLGLTQAHEIGDFHGLSHAVFSDGADTGRATESPG